MPDAPDQASTQQVDDTADDSAEQEASAGQGSADDRLRALESELKKVRREAAGYRVKLKEHEDAKLSETEKATQRIKELEDQVSSLQAKERQAAFQATIARAATKAGAIDPEAIALIAPLPEGDEFDADKLVGQIKQQRPRLFAGAAGSADGGSTGRAAASDDMNARIRLAAGRG